MSQPFSLTVHTQCLAVTRPSTPPARGNELCRTEFVRALFQIALQSAGSRKKSQMSDRAKLAGVVTSFQHLDISVYRIIFAKCLRCTLYHSQSVNNSRSVFSYSDYENRKPSSINTSDRTSSRRHPDTLTGGITHENQASKGYSSNNQQPANPSTSRICALDDFVCADGTCIPETHHCDHFYDCRDFTDEQYCFG
ncbi:uncharacterized protein LOC143153401 [Ptiloglossa arizonensis]|uniref:uncharacterized protein LOC143153401 n=1 Tax=Ptiloglossa arizonensis TaxID=3350558 RepID=UPI003F9FE4DF